VRLFAGGVMGQADERSPTDERGDGLWVPSRDTSPHGHDSRRCLMPPIISRLRAPNCWYRHQPPTSLAGQSPTGCLRQPPGGVDYTTHSTETRNAMLQTPTCVV